MQCLSVTKQLINQVKKLKPSWAPSDVSHVWGALNESTTCTTPSSQCPLIHWPSHSPIHCINTN